MHTGSVSASVCVYSNDNIPGGKETVRIPSRLTVSLHVSQWCSGKFALVGTLAWHYDHMPYGYLWGWGGGGFLNELSIFKCKNRCSNIEVY